MPETNGNGKIVNGLNALSSVYQPVLDFVYSAIDRVGTKAVLTGGFDFAVGYAAWYTILKIDFNNPNVYTIGMIALELLSMAWVTVKYFEARQPQDAKRSENGGTTTTTPQP